MLTVRPCDTEFDLAHAAELMAELGAWDSAEAEKLGFSAQSVLDFYYPAQAAAADKAESGLILLGRIGSEVAGCVALQELQPGIGEVKRLYVRPAYRRSGLGRALISSLIAHARAAGYECLRLETVSFMNGAIRMYGEMGFVRRTPYYEIPDVFLPITIFMEKLI